MEWWQILWAIMALVLIGPMVYRIITNDPQMALKSVAGWLGFALLAGWLYANTGIAEWWEAKHGGRYDSGTSSVFGGEEREPEERSRFPGE